MSVEKFIANRISGSDQNKGNISKPIVKIGIIGISVGVCVMLLTVSIVLGFKKEIVNKITGLTTHVTISNINRNASNEPEPISISKDSLEMIKKFPFIQYIQSTAFKNGLLKTDKENEGILLKGVGKEYDFDFIKDHLVEGRVLGFEVAESGGEIMISEILATKMDLHLNEKIQVYFISQHEVYDSLQKESYVKAETRSRKFKICGIFKTDFSDFDKQLSIVDLKQIQRLNFWDSTKVGAYELTVKDFDKVDKNAVEVQDLLGYNYKVSSVKEIYSNIFVWLDKLDINGIIVVVLMILVATINMITALLILILERANMVGLVKAFGLSNAGVRRIFLWISYKLIGRGMLWGNIAGIGLCLLQYYFRIVPLDGETYYVDYVAIDINWWYFLLLNLGTFIVCALMLFLPTLILTKITPIKTLKFD